MVARHIVKSCNQFPDLGNIMTHFSTKPDFYVCGNCMWGVILSNWPTRQHYELRLTLQANIHNHPRLKQEKYMLPAARFLRLG